MKSRIRAGWGVVLAAALAAVVGVGALGQDVSQRAAVRLSYVDGHVRLSKANASGTMLPFIDQAIANTPLFEGTQLQTGDDGRAELQFDDGTIVRIAPDSTLTLSVLRAGQSELMLNSGMGYFELKSGAEKVDFSGVTATASGPATLRVKLDTPPGSVAVFDGAVHLEGNGGTADLHGGQSTQLNAQGGGFEVADSIEPDSWDAWNSDRDQALEQTGGASPATQGVADSANPAWDDLNDSGKWYNVPDQGYVWSPYEAADSTWDPYGDGSWMWTPGYGYIWISGEPWGYMPYQCGTWNWYDNFGWGWLPGGCTPWWGGGGGVWAINVGGYPVGWRRPIRPIRPHGPRPVHPLPLVPVHRQGPAVDALLPLRDRRTPVQIGNATVHPVGRTIRPVNDHQLPARGGARFGYAPANRGTTVPRPVYRPMPSGNSHARPATGNMGGPHFAPAPRMSAPPAPRMSAPPAPSRPR